MVLPLDLAFGNSPPNTTAPDFAAHCQWFITDARTKMAQAQVYQKWYYDAQYHPIEFVVGQEVLLATKNLPLAATTSKLLTPQFIGLFCVLAHVGN